MTEYMYDLPEIEYSQEEINRFQQEDSERAIKRAEAGADLQKPSRFRDISLPDHIRIVDVPPHPQYF